MQLADVAGSDEMFKILNDVDGTARPNTVLTTVTTGAASEEYSSLRYNTLIVSPDNPIVPNAKDAEEPSAEPTGTSRKRTLQINCAGSGPAKG